MASQTITDLGNAIINFVNGKIVTSISSSSTDTTVPSAKCVYDAIQAGGGGGVTVDQTYNSSSANPQSGVAIAGAGFQTTGNLVTSVSSSSTNSQYPSAILFYDTVGNIEAALQAINGE